MATITYSDIVESVKRTAKWSVISGSFVETDILNYIEDSSAYISVDYPDFTVFTFGISGTILASTITPDPDIIDKVLLAVKASELIVEAWGLEQIGDAVMIKTGAIVLDTTKSLRAHGINLDHLNNEYMKLTDNLNRNGKSTDTSSMGVRIDNFISKRSDIGNKDPESLI